MAANLRLIIASSHSAFFKQRREIASSSASFGQYYDNIQEIKSIPSKKVSVINDVGSFFNNPINTDTEDGETQIDESFDSFLQDERMLFAQARTRRYNRATLRTHPLLPTYGMTVSEAFTAWAATTKMHGIGHAVLHRDGKDRRTIANYVFILALLVYFALATALSVELVTEFADYPVLAQTNYYDQAEMDFPAVTFCNMNKVKIGNNPPSYYPLHEEAVGHVLKDMLISCSFGGETCNTSDFTWLWLDQLGNCYTFNSHINNQGQVVPSRKVFFPGNDSSLTLVLDFQPHLYSPKSSSVGIVIAVHDRTLRAVPQVALSTGWWNTFQITKTVIEDEGTPYNDCMDDKVLKNHENFFEDRFNYSCTACRETCLQVRAMAKFKCCITNYPCNPLGRSNAFGIELKPYIKHCNSSPPNGISEKLYRDWSMLEMENCQKLCKIPCNITRYELLPIWSKLKPTKDREGDLDDNIDGDLHKTKGGHPNNSSNLLVVQFNLVAGYSRQYKTTPKYDWIDLISNLGGILSVFFGFTLPILLEIIVLLIDIVYIMYMLMFRASRRKIGQTMDRFR